LEELEKIVKEAQQAAFAKDIAELEALLQPLISSLLCKFFMMDFQRDGEKTCVMTNDTEAFS
jgi:hypothetical protein